MSFDCVVVWNVVLLFHVESRVDDDNVQSCAVCNRGCFYAVLRCPLRCTVGTTLWPAQVVCPARLGTVCNIGSVLSCRWHLISDNSVWRLMEIIRTVPSRKHTHTSSSYRWTRACWVLCMFFISFSSWFVCCVYFLLVVVFGCQYQYNWLLGNTCLRNELLCFELVINHSLTQFVTVLKH